MGRPRDFPDYTPRYNGHLPTSVSLENQTFVVESWRNVLLKTCELVHDRKPSQFARILELKGSKRLWFSRNPNELQDPVRIHGTDIFAEANLNANGVVLRSLQVLNLFGLVPKINVKFRRIPIQ